jgi:hypothetical protein
MDVSMPESNERQGQCPSLPVGRPTYYRARRLFLRALGLIYFIAFVFWPQSDGLVGHDGIVPVASWLEQVRNHFGTLSPFGG